MEKKGGGDPGNWHWNDDQGASFLVNKYSITNNKNTTICRRMIKK